MKKIEGGYYCGYITYEATVNPDLVVICHCTDCQTLSGTTFRIGVFAPQGNFKLLTGAPKFYLKTTASGTKRKLAFCPECGTSIYSSDTSDAPVFWIRVGTCRQRAELIPKFQIWCRSAQSWVQNLGALRQYQEQPPLPR